MKFLPLTFALLLFTALPVLASGEHGNSTDSILEDIVTAQNVQSAEQIDCEKITENDWERLGDAVMGLMHPEEDTHSRIDEMMGGEGSPTLREAHIQMGRQYVGCGTASSTPMRIGGMGMMDGSIMDTKDYKSFNRGADNFGFYNMMGGSFAGLGFGYGGMVFGWALMLLFWVLAFLGLVWVIKIIISKKE